MPLARLFRHLGFGYVNSLADHQTSMQHKQGHNRVKFEHGSLHPKTHRYLSQCPALVYPVSHYLHIDERHGNWGSFEVLGLAGLVLGYHCDGDIEASKTCEAAEHEKREKDVVERCA